MIKKERYVQTINGHIFFCGELGRGKWLKIQQYVSFPNFNINLKISKIVFLGIHWYATIIVSAIAIAIAIIIYSKDKIKYGIKIEQVYNLLIYVLPISIIAARMYYILFKLEYYTKNPIQIFNIRDEAWQFMED